MVPGVCDEPVSLLDLYPTLVDLCGLPENNHIDGKSLVPLIENPEKEWPYPVISVWRYRNYSIRSKYWRYIRYRDGTEELYDHRNDPGEHINLANDPQYEKIIEEHKKWLLENDALPAGTSEWKGDKLDRRIKEWISTDSIPAWLR